MLTQATPRRFRKNCRYHVALIPIISVFRGSISNCRLLPYRVQPPKVCIKAISLRKDQCDTVFPLDQIDPSFHLSGETVYLLLVIFYSAASLFTRKARIQHVLKTQTAAIWSSSALQILMIYNISVYLEFRST